MKRWLDGIYFSHIRHNPAEVVCFSDMTLAEQRLILSTMPNEGKDELCIHLARIIRGLGDKFDLIREEPQK